MNYIKVTDVENEASFQFNNSKALECLLSDINGFEDGIAINSIDDVASKIGAKEVNSKTGRRVFSFVARFTCDTLDNRQLMLAALRRTGYLKLIEFQTLDSLNLRCLAYFDKLNAPYSGALNKPMLLQFTAPDPRFYSQTLHNQEIARNTSEVVENAGNEATCPIFRINGPITTAAITNLNNTQEMAITHTLLEGEYIDIDCANQTVTDNEGTEVYSSLDNTPDFISLDPGENTIQFADSGGGTATNLEVIFRDAYNGI